MFLVKLLYFVLECSRVNRKLRGLAPMVFYEKVYRTASHGINEAKADEMMFRFWLVLWGSEILSESVELMNAPNQTEVNKEAGDVVWSITASAMLLKLDEAKVFKVIKPEKEIDKTAKHLKLISDAGVYAELAKKISRDYPKREIDRAHLTQLLNNVCSSLNTICSLEYGLYLVEKKLLERYPHGFDSQRSINR